MSVKAPAPTKEQGSLISAAEADALTALYRELPATSAPEWCDLTPDVEVESDEVDGFATARIQ